MSCRSTRADEEPTSFVGLVFDVMQESALTAMDNGLDLAHKGVLYVAREIVYALGDGEVDENLTISSGKELKKSTSTKWKKEKSKKKKKSEKARETKSRRKGYIDPDVKLYNAEAESRDEVNVKSYRVKDLIGKFGGHGKPPGVPSPHFSASPQQQKKDPPLAAQGQDPQPSAESTSNTLTQHDNNSHEVFRPRSVTQTASEDQDRFSYFQADEKEHELMQTMSLLLPFKELHRANQKALFDRDIPVTGSFQARATESNEFVESFLASSGLASSGAHDGLHLAVDPKESIQEQNTLNLQEQRASEIVDIRAEIEDVHRILDKLQKQQDERRRQQSFPTQSTDPPTKDSLQGRQDLITLISRLQRLARRHEELKAQIAAATVPGRLSPIAEGHDMQHRTPPPLETPSQLVL